MHNASTTAVGQILQSEVKWLRLLRQFNWSSQLTSLRSSRDVFLVFKHVTQREIISEYAFTLIN
jgi:hypothetical protein